MVEELEELEEPAGKLELELPLALAGCRFDHGQPSELD